MTIIYLHIGMPKTGTSFLENFLFDNREKLLEKGYLYPITGTNLSSQSLITRSAHRQLVISLLKQHHHRSNGVDNLGIWEELKSEIKTTQPKSVIISSEAFTGHQGSYNPEVIALTKKMLEEYETKIVVYLRRQDKFLSSYYCQRIKSPGSIDAAVKTDIKEFILEWKYQADYYSVLELWKDSFGVKNIIVRPFEKEQMKNGSLVDDFLETVNLNNNGNEFQFIQHLNTSPSFKVIRTIIWLEKNIQKIQFSKPFQKQLQKHEKLRYLFPKIKHITKPFILSKGVSSFISSLPEFIISNKDIFSQEDRVSIMKEFEESNRKVAKEYLGREDGRLFYSQP